jgi:hypothetical protein
MFAKTKILFTSLRVLWPNNLLNSFITPLSPVVHDLESFRNKFCGIGHSFFLCAVANVHKLTNALRRKNVISGHTIKSRTRLEYESAR